MPTLVVKTFRDPGPVTPSMDDPEIIATLDSSNFTAGHRYLIMTWANVRANRLSVMNEILFGGAADDRFTTQYRCYYNSSGGGMPVFAMAMWTAAASQDIEWRTTPFGRIGSEVFEFYEVAIFAIDLDSSGLSSNDWMLNDNNSTLALTTDYADVTGANLTFKPDGISSYLVIGCGGFKPNGLGVVANYVGMQLYDSIDGQLCENVVGNQQESYDEAWGHSAMWVLDQPSSVQRTLSLRFNSPPYAVWKHNHSCLFVLRLNAFHSFIFGQDIKDTNYPTGIYNLQSETFLPVTGEALMFGRIGGFSRSDQQRLSTQLVYWGGSVQANTNYQTAHGTYSATPPLPPNTCPLIGLHMTGLSGSAVTRLRISSASYYSTLTWVYENCLVMFDLGFSQPHTEISGKATSQSSAHGNLRVVAPGSPEIGIDISTAYGPKIL